ncbi:MULTISPECIES: thioesterase family protein [unclassified Brevundimonas]|uniref:acyl-CoA thioesterase n=1 Tax=unclassified Brevundimonas TaxID=2622653 RepID=UPI0006F8D3B3|nr:MULTISPECIES: acyl-CoA thioesterase [unclassified Brevundimonas]KQY70123.1 thioesterase [Brevundimonas sp. Root1423]KRA28831.1 thioesterase [Brevundimonas sp. Root608]
MARAVLEPRDDREIFVVPLTVLPEHIDDNGHVNNVVYVGWLQDAGTAHWNARFDGETRARWSWVAVRHEIDYFRPLPPGAQGVVARTWVGDPHGPRFNRYVHIEDGEGRLCAQGVSEWVLVDATTLRPHRIPPTMLPTFERRS